MSINEMLEKIKPFYTFILLVVIGSIFFALGRLSTLEMAKTKVKIEYPNTDQTSSVIVSEKTTQNQTVKSVSKPAQPSTVAVPALPQSTEVIGSKTGKKYYFPWCGTVKRIKPENQIHFGTIEEAKNAGYVAGGNCKGLK